MSRRVLVTGGASGIGLAVVEAFTRQGDHVVSLDRVDSVSATLSVVGDVTSPADQVAAVEAATGGSGRLDVLVANAGLHDGGLGLDAPPEDLAKIARAVLDVDVVGYMISLDAATPSLRAAHGCAILTLSDASFLAGHTGAGIAYTAAKYAGLGIMRWAARALAPEVRVNAVAPGGVLTGLRAVAPDGGERGLFDDAAAKEQSIRSRNALSTIMTAEEVAALFIFLASSAARGMTGQILRPDGGLGLM